MPTTVTSSAGTEFHLFQLSEGLRRQANPAIEFTELRNDLGNGYRAQLNFGSATGLRSWSLTYQTLAGTGVPVPTVTGVNGETCTREEYLWELYCETRITGKPFVYQCPRNGLYYLVDFVDKRLQYEKQMQVKLYSTGVEIQQVREDGETIFSPVALPGIVAWYTEADNFPTTIFVPGATDGWANSAFPSDSANGLSVTGDVIKATAVQNGLDVVRFSSTANTGVLTGPPGGTLQDFTLQEAFVVMKMREATFSNFAGILTGENTTGGNAALVGSSGTALFTDFSFGDAYEYRKNNTLYANNAQAAPMNAFGIVHIRHTSGIPLAGFQVGADRDFVGRFAEVDIGEMMLFSTAQPKTIVREIYENLSVKWDIAIAA